MSRDESVVFDTVDDLLGRYDLGPREEIEFTPRSSTNPPSDVDEMPEALSPGRDCDRTLVRSCKIAMRTRLSGHRRNHGSTERGLWVAVCKRLTGINHDKLRRHFDVALAELTEAPDIAVVGDLFIMNEEAALAFERKRGRQLRAEQAQGRRPRKGQRYVRKGSGQRARRGDSAA